MQNEELREIGKKMTEGGITGYGKREILAPSPPWPHPTPEQEDIKAQHSIHFAILFRRALRSLFGAGACDSVLRYPLLIYS